MKTAFIVIVLATIIVAQELNGGIGENRDLARKKKTKLFHFLGFGFGIHALAILYWLKVKAIIISFFVGTAAIWAFKYFTHQKSCPEVIHEGPVIPYDHGPSWSSHDHIPYSSHSSDFYPEHEPYGGYSYGDSSPPEIIDATSHPHRRVTKGRQITTEDQVSEMVFSFLGVGSAACRKRFLCEMEFRSNDNPLTSMAFRIIGRGVFSKYVRKLNQEPVPRSFTECAEVHRDCKFIEEDIDENEINEIEEDESSTTVQVPASSSTTLTKHRVDSVAETILRRPNK